MFTQLKIIAICFVTLFICNSSFADHHDDISSSKTIVMKKKLEVVAINHEKRWFRLKDISGFTRTIEVGDEIQNFDQISVGDMLKVRYSETVSIEVFDADSAELGDVEEALFARADKGEIPAAIGAVVKTYVVTIAEIDIKNSQVTLQDKQGNTKMFRPRIPANLKKVKIGDKVVISFATALAMKIEKDGE
jgi:hypothetical protein